MPDIPQVFTTLRSPMLGVEAESLGSQLAGYFGVKEGVLVRSVLKDTPAEKAGIKAGDVITKVDGSGVTTPNELVQRRPFGGLQEDVLHRTDARTQGNDASRLPSRMAGRSELFRGFRADARTRVKTEISFELRQAQPINLQQQFHFFARNAQRRGDVVGPARPSWPSGSPVCVC